MDTDPNAYVFAYCKQLVSLIIPNCTSILNCAVGWCTSLSTLSLPACTFISNVAFGSCHRLLNLYLLTSTIPTLNHINAFNSTPISNYTELTGGIHGSIFVKASLLDSFKTATN